MSEKVEKDAFERLVDRVLSYKPKKAEKKRQKRRKAILARKSKTK
jgi:hypothetical protein